MVDIKPFRAVRPAKGLESRTAALPYDVYDRQEAREAAHKDPMSFLNIDRPETQFPPEQDMYSPEVYRKAHDLLWQEIRDGVYAQDEKAMFYLYELTMEGRSQTGLVACASIDDYLNGTIRRHENTRVEKEQDRAAHIEACGAQTGPVFLAYRTHPQMARLVGRVKEREPLFDFVSEDGIRHRGWQIGEEGEIAAICTFFAGMEGVYIADGHHRAASAVRIGQKIREASGPGGQEESSRLLCVLFPEEELKILDYNRVVDHLNGHSPEEFLLLVSSRCDITLEKEPVHPRQKGEFGMYLSGRWYRLTLREEYRSADPVDGLDVSALQREILGPLLGIDDPRTSTHIRFVGGIRGLGELEKLAGPSGIAFSMYPTSIRELFLVADEGRLMPPKSTWFEPKLRSGLFIHLITGGGETI